MSRTVQVATPVALLGFGAILVVRPQLVMVAVVAALVAPLTVVRFRSRRRTAWEPDPRWWAHPAVLALLVGTPCVLAAWLTSASSFEELWQTPKFYDGVSALLALGCLLAFAAAAAVTGSRGRRPTASTEEVLDHDRAAHAARVLFLLTLLGYVAWGLVAVERGLTAGGLHAILSGSPGAVSQVKSAFLSPVTGVTTLTQFGPVAATLYFYLHRSGRRRALAQLLVLSLLALVRTVFYSERLAIVEIVVPIGFLALNGAWGARSRLRKVAQLFPLWAPVALLVFFGAFEYLRSWDAYYKHVSDRGSYSTFALHRLEGYYATAQNNSALLTRNRDAASGAYYTANWFWRFPGVSRAISNDAPTTWKSLLAVDANPQFNNEGSFLVPVAEFGTLGALAVWLALGALVGKLYASFVDRRPEGLLLYPTMVTGLLEIGRIYYWAEGRVFPIVVGALWAAHYIRAGSRREAPAIELRALTS